MPFNIIYTYNFNIIWNSKNDTGNAIENKTVLGNTFKNMTVKIK